MKRRERMEYGYKAYTGRILSNAQVDAYNRIQDEINMWIDAGRAVPEFLLNASHRQLVISATI